ncbi:hypothetical protein ACYOEI_30760 [Singulisphaera rosea]
MIRVPTCAEHAKGLAMSLADKLGRSTRVTLDPHENWWVGLSDTEKPRDHRLLTTYTPRAPRAQCDQSSISNVAAAG